MSSVLSPRTQQGRETGRTQRRNRDRDAGRTWVVSFCGCREALRLCSSHTYRVPRHRPKSWAHSEEAPRAAPHRKHCWERSARRRHVRQGVQGAGPLMGTESGGTGGACPAPEQQIHVKNADQSCGRASPGRPEPRPPARLQGCCSAWARAPHQDNRLTFPPLHLQSPLLHSWPMALLSILLRK